MLAPLHLPLALPALVPAVGALAALLSTASALPQLWRTCGRGEVAGVPPARFWLGVAMSSCWLVYGLLARDIVQVATNAVVGAMGLAQLAALLRLSPAAREVASAYGSGLAAWLGVVGAAACSGGLPAVGALGAAVGVGSTLPQLLHLLRTPGDDVSGVSVPGLVAMAACAATWALYGSLRGEVAVWAPAAVQAGLHLWTLRLVLEPPLVPAGRVPARCAAGE